MTAEEFAANLGTGTEEYADSFHRTLDAATERLAEAQHGDEAGDVDSFAEYIEDALTFAIGAAAEVEIGARRPFHAADLAAEFMAARRPLWLAARDAERRRLGADAERGFRFRVEVACDGYANLMDSDVPAGISDLAAYQEGAHDAAEAIRAAAQQVSER
jgi:hypothetical protein